VAILSAANQDEAQAINKNNLPGEEVLDVSQMIKCQNCGTLVPAEKAFCPNCSEPMEVEEKSNRNSFSSDMMSTIRDDPEKYKEMLRDLKQKQQQQQPPPPLLASTAQAAHPPSPPVMNTGQPASQPVAGYNQWQAAPPAPAPQGNSKRAFILGISVVALLAIIIVLLFVFKVI
jgi:predicted nucleic acid-binding Zn ribbon protein